MDPKCPDCGKAVLEDFGVAACSGCGRKFSGRAALSRWRDEHKDEILADLEKRGPKAAGEKWRIPGGSWPGLLNRWKLKTREPKATAPDKRSNGAFPPLPAWRDDWPSPTQVAWLEVYDRLSGERSTANDK